MTRTSWVMVSLLGFIVGSLGVFVLMQANRAAAVLTEWYPAPLADQREPLASFEAVPPPDGK